MTPTKAPPPSVLIAYGWLPAQLQISPVQPGFSGAIVWQLHVEDKEYALKQWPARHPVYLPLPAIHDLMQQAYAAGLPFIPQVKKTLQGESCLQLHGHLWDVTTWQPGVAQNDPNDTQLIAAVRAVSQLHSIWHSSNQSRQDVCPAVQLQHQSLSAWTLNDFNKLQPWSNHQPAYQLAVELFRRHREPALKRLQPWLNRKVTIHPCLADLWSDHVLFTAGEVTGIIDFGGMRYDHPAQDLARLLGSYTQGNAERRMSALAAYFPQTDKLEALTILLDDCGAVVGLGNWLRWLGIEQQAFSSPDRVLARLHSLTNRLSRHGFPHF